MGQVTQFPQPENQQETHPLTHMNPNMIQTNLTKIYTNCTQNPEPVKHQQRHKKYIHFNFNQKPKIKSKTTIFNHHHHIIVIHRIVFTNPRNKTIKNFQFVQ